MTKLNDATVENSKENYQSNDFNLIEFLIVLAKNKRLIFTIPLLVAAISTAVSFALPNVYKATTKLLPPQQTQSAAGALLSQLGGMAAVAGLGAGLKNPNDVYAGMLKSRTIADRLIDRFNLSKIYETSSLEKTRAKLEENTLISISKDGLITIEVEGKQKNLVAPLANSYVEELAALTTRLALTDASQRRLFFEQQLEQTKNKLATSEFNLKRTLETKGVISVDADSRAVLATVSYVRAQISAKEIQLNSMKPFMTSSNSNMRRIEEELKSLRVELSHLENGRGNAEANTEEGRQPGLSNIKLLREVKYHQMLYELLAKQYEAARLDEARESSVVQVLDKAIEPEQKFKPRRSTIILVSTVLSLFATISLILLLETKKRALGVPGVAAQWYELRSQLSLKK